MKKKEIIIVLGILVVCIISYFGFNMLYQNVNSENVTVYYRDEVLFKVDSNVDDYIEFEGSYGTLYLEVKDGSWRITNEECPNHICSSMGWQNHDDIIPIFCEPNEILVVSEDEDE